MKQTPPVRRPLGAPLTASDVKALIRSEDRDDARREGHAGFNSSV